jgi:hypothetical protein
MKKSPNFVFLKKLYFITDGIRGGLCPPLGGLYSIHQQAVLNGKSLIK